MSDDRWISQVLAAYPRYVLKCLTFGLLYYILWLIDFIIHPIDRSKSSYWLKEGHMTWFVFDNVHAWKLIHECYFLLFPCLSKKLSQLPNLELDSLLSRFNGSVRTKKSVNGVCKTNVDCSFIQGMVENYWTLGKIQPWPTIHLHPMGLWV